MKPKLKQFGDLTEVDFAKHSIWIACHTADYDEPWYEAIDEETFRPRNGDLPAEPSEGMLLVRAKAVLADGTELPGFLTPGFKDDGLGIMQPCVFIEGRRFSFWGGMFGVPQKERTMLYKALAKDSKQVFPIRFAAEEGLTTGVQAAEIRGFYKIRGDDLKWSTSRDIG